ncbi:hypothetical protein, partial [Vibrio echinoideorum]
KSAGTAFDGSNPSPSTIFSLIGKSKSQLIELAFFVSEFYMLIPISLSFELRPKTVVIVLLQFSKGSIQYQSFHTSGWRSQTKPSGQPKQVAETGSSHF